MAVDYFIDACKWSSNNRTFGLCDEPKPNEDPAYIAEDHQDEWIAIVHNDDRKEAVFYAIDNCIAVAKLNSPNKSMSRCDGMLMVDQFYTFIELKDCKLKNRYWRREGKRQLEATIERFLKENPTIKKRHQINAYVCNKKQRQNNVIYQDAQDEFTNKTGVVLMIQRHIHL